MQNGQNGETTENNIETKEQNPNKITIFEILVILLLIFCIWLYISPNFLLKLENRKNAQIQTNASIFIAKALSEFSMDKNAKKPSASTVSKKLINELNEVNKNPYSKKTPAYSLSEKCDGCVIVTPDDKMSSITVEAYTTDDILLVRTILQPPSFVTYVRDLADLEKKENRKTKSNKRSE